MIVCGHDLLNRGIHLFLLAASGEGRRQHRRLLPGLMDRLNERAHPGHRPIKFTLAVNLVNIAHGGLQFLQLLVLDHCQVAVRIHGQNQEVKKDPLLGRREIGKVDVHGSKLLYRSGMAIDFEGFSLNRTAFPPTHGWHMAKALSKSQIAASLAEAVGLTKKQAVETIEALVSLAYKNAKNSFTIPGLGKLVLVNRKARMGRNPATGATIKIPAKRVVKFRVAKAAKDAILGVKK